MFGDIGPKDVPRQMEGLCMISFLNIKGSNVWIYQDSYKLFVGLECISHI